MIFLYALFVLSIIFPLYTYAFYPIILRFLKQKKHDAADITPYVSIVVTGSDFDRKRDNLKNINYAGYEILESRDLNDSINKAKGEIVVFTDGKSDFDSDVLSEIVKPFADENVDGVVGMQTSKSGNSAFWKYENYVRRMESRIGCVSGANDTIFAVRKKSIPIVPESILNKMFYIAMEISQTGKNIVFSPAAIAYEYPSGGTNFEKHVSDAAGYWQAFRLFWKMLLPRKGHFVYVSHRVMKWFVWLNLLVAFIISGVFAISSRFFLCLFVCQIIGYIGTITLGRKKVKGAVGKIIGIAYYFMMLNVAYARGLFK